MTIEVAGLSKSFTTGRGRKQRVVDAVHDLSFVAEAGERLAYIGHNGAGKSTSIKMLTGILHPTSGEVSVLGFVPWKERKAVAGRIGTLFGQRSQLWLELTPRQSLRVLGGIFGIDAERYSRRGGGLGGL